MPHATPKARPSRAQCDPEGRATDNMVASLRRVAGALRAIGEAKGVDTYRTFSTTLYSSIHDGARPSFRQARYFLTVGGKYIDELKRLPDAPQGTVARRTGQPPSPPSRKPHA